MTEQVKQKREYKSFTFKCSTEWTGKRTWVARTGSAPAIEGGSPPEFKGEEGRWSSEHLLLASVNSCHIASFISYSSRKGFEFASLESEIEGLLERDGTTYRYTKMIIRPRITVKSGEDVETARQYMHRAHELCFMSSSVNAEVIVEPEIIVA